MGAYVCIVYSITYTKAIQNIFQVVMAIYCTYMNMPRQYDRIFVYGLQLT